jgi:hypothetical protein
MHENRERTLSFAPAGALLQFMLTGGRALRACPRLFSFGPFGARKLEIIGKLRLPMQAPLTSNSDSYPETLSKSVSRSLESSGSALQPRQVWLIPNLFGMLTCRG